ncbi:MAG TPA: L,D-transpeptidase family protein, partial [Hyphomicrobiaceae bacterium]|nr:L,D-transpeptidase family protein [Hyphomicrobiaceae bacterium]
MTTVKTSGRTVIDGGSILQRMAPLSCIMVFCLTVLASLVLSPMSAFAADPRAPIDERDDRAASPAAVALPTLNPARVAAADNLAEQEATKDGTGVSASASPIARALRGLLAAPAPERLQGAPKSWNKDRIGAEAEALAHEHEALKQFYAARADAPIWVSPEGMTDKGHQLVAAIADGAAYGLDPDLIPLPARVPLPVQASQAAAASTAEEAAPDASSLAAQELALSRAALVYARHARGGRIPEPAEMLNSNLDRKPQLLSPIVVMADLVEATDMAAALAKLHPVHPQFEKLRQAFLAETGGNGQGKLNAKAKRLRANMEFWRWMWDDLGELYVFNNIPEYMQTVVLKGEVVRRAKIVVGETGKQSSVFSRPLKEVVLRPRWRVPESIMVRELWPSLRRGGGLMRQHGLEITTKSGEPLDWRDIDWTRDDIRNYLVWQPPGAKSSLGFVKFSFPSQHTIFMHDTPDKWMFNRGRRTLSHGCLRVKDPLQLTEIVLGYDHGWDRDKIKKLIASGPLDNKIEMNKHIPIHIAYFTAWADED